jgi:hypothetical protein
VTSESQNFTEFTSDSADQFQRRLEERIDQRFEERFESLAKRFEEFTAKLQDLEPLKSYKGKGKGKKSSNKTLQEQINAEAEKRLQRFLEEQRQRESSVDLHSSDHPSNDRRDIPSTSRGFHQETGTRNQTTSRERSETRAYAASQASDCMTEDLRSIRGVTTRNVFIRRIDCLLNANPIDQIEDKQSG